MSDQTNQTLHVFSFHVQIGQFSDITPEAIKAQDGDTGINEPVVYSITAGALNRRFIRLNVSTTSFWTDMIHSKNSSVKLTLLVV